MAINLSWWQLSVFCESWLNEQRLLIHHPSPFTSACWSPIEDKSKIHYRKKPNDYLDMWLHTTTAKGSLWNKTCNHTFSEIMQSPMAFTLSSRCLWTGNLKRSYKWIYKNHSLWQLKCRVWGVLGLPTFCWPSYSPMLLVPGLGSTWSANFSLDLIFPYFWGARFGEYLACQLFVGPHIPLFLRCQV